ncbi:hypothetical protein J2S43_003318 [Catenuloplanes nepalensis]|uniref:Uncharacterized protein n=1 Tax=Catenuloplanes nepalensis TaxID=587533 RepID=A0ABT9MU47_9ACTN|nr:hypothetical protein [Catenuloplanes nepalensis]MDP9794806.1 hypothetical protein [Catenuloplanes nepalensis]
MSLSAAHRLTPEPPHTDGLSRHWDKGGKIMSSRGGTAELRNRSQARDACVARGAARC